MLRDMRAITSQEKCIDITETHKTVNDIGLNEQLKTFNKIVSIYIGELDKVKYPKLSSSAAEGALGIRKEIAE